MLDYRVGIDQVMSVAWFPPDMMLAIMSGGKSKSFIHHSREYSHYLSVLQVPFGKRQADCHMPVTEEWLSFGRSTYMPRWWSAAEMVFLLEGSPVSKNKTY